MKIDTSKDLPFTRIIVAVLAVVFLAVFFTTESPIFYNSLPAYVPNSIEENHSMDLYVFFNNQSMDGEIYDCKAKYPLPRRVSLDGPYESQLMQYLISGPTEEEKELGYSSIFSSNTSGILRSFKVVSGIAYINFGDLPSIIPSGSSSCGSESLTSSIEATLSQFPVITEYRYAINGSPKDFYEWIQRGCPSEDACNPDNFK